MTADEIGELLAKVREESSLVHCITNPISISRCADAVLAVGAKPIMAEHPDEVREITKTSRALLLNLGNITDVRMKSMEIAADEAGKSYIPITLDLVGVACSKLRRDFAMSLAGKFHMSIVKGNYSEVKAFYDCSYKGSGVDSESGLDEDEIAVIAAQLASQHCCTVLASGKNDIVTDGNITLYVKNGTPKLAGVTGTGCILGALAACFLTATKAVEAAEAACAVLGVCGELSNNSAGSGSFMAELMDKLSDLPKEDIVKYLNVEVEEFEKL